MTINTFAPLPADLPMASPEEVRPLVEVLGRIGPVIDRHEEPGVLGTAFRLFNQESLT